MIEEEPTEVEESKVRVLHLEDSELDHCMVVEMLKQSGLDCEIIRAEDGPSFQAALEQPGLDVIISDFSLPGYSGSAALELARELRKEVPFIFFSGTLGEEAAIESLKNGATDYVLKQRPERLPVAVRRAIAEASAHAAQEKAEEELRRRDALLRKIIDNVEDSIAVVDLNGALKLISPSLRRLFGDQPPEVGADFLSYAHPDDRARIQQAFHATIQQEAGQRVEYRLILPDGSVRIVEAHGTVMPDEHQMSQFVLWVARDITERRRVEEQILEQAALLDEAHDAICVTDLDQRIQFWNRSATRLYGWASSEALGRNATELLRQSANALDALKMLIRSGEWQGELAQTTREGQQLIVESRWTLVRGSDGLPKSILIINTDVTARKLAERKVREQAELLDKARDAILVCDLHHKRIAYWNEGATRLYGWTAEEALHRTIGELLFAQTPADWDAIQSTLAERDEWVGELRQRTKAGEEVIVRCRQTLIRDAESRPESILLINSDITEQKKIETQFLRTQRMESIGSLAGSVAHDLNNVLGPIMTAAEIVQTDPQNQSNQTLLKLIETNAHRGSELVKQILSFARGVSGEKARLPLGPVVEEVSKLVKNTFPRSVALRTEVPRDLPSIHADGTQMHQVLLNLCVNARDAMPSGGEIAIEARPVALEGRTMRLQPEPVSGAFVEVKVSDTGTGISPETLGKIFEPFFTTKEAGKGTGLGLSTVVRIVKGHGGFMDVQSEVGKGTAFTIYFPALAKMEIDAKTAAKAGLTLGRNERILIVDDEVAILEIVKVTLVAFNYRATVAKSGAEAVAVFTKAPVEIDLVITDLLMPDMNGSELIAALRKIRADVPIIAVSGIDSRSESSPVDIQRFVQKPYTTATLLEAIRSTLDDKKKEA